MTSFNNLSQSEREAILNRIRDPSDDAPDLIKDSQAASDQILWSAKKTQAEAIVYAIALS